MEPNMANPIDAALNFHAKALNVRASRQELLASNIANADTPGYKARDLDFGKTLHAALGTGAASSGTPGNGGVNLVRTAAGHLPGAAQKSGPGAALYRTVVQPSIDGNTVDMDVERAQFADNAIHYEANLQFLNSQLKSLLAAIQG
jgi:flagellar basal-body rod protein FlgB